MKNKEKSSINAETLQKQHADLLSVSQRFCDEINNQLVRLLEDNEIVLGFPIQHRVKTWNSISDKLSKLKFPIKDIKGIQDLIGLRIILLFKRDTSQVCNLIEKSFNVIKKYNTDERLKEDQFGYSSIHFVIELPEEWLAVPTFTAFSKFRAEIQVRTIAQHIWAAASHTLQYKQEVSVPATVLRSIYRVSALLETVDLEFERVLDEREIYRSKLNTSDIDKVLNVDLLEKILDYFLPAENKILDEEYAQLLEELNMFEISTSDSLQKLLEKHQEKIKQQEADIIANKKNIVFFGNEETQRFNRGIFFTHTGLMRAALEAEFGVRWEEYMESLPDDYEDDDDYEDIDFQAE